jgi:hypothetical protein
MIVALHIAFTMTPHAPPAQPDRRGVDATAVKLQAKMSPRRDDAAIVVAAYDRRAYIGRCNFFPTVDVAHPHGRDNPQGTLHLAC